MGDIELCGLTLVEASRALRGGALSPLELTRAYLDRIDAHNPTLNAYITVTADRALADARRATEELVAGRSRGALHGVPIGLKDLYETAGIPTTGGAKIHADHVPVGDCTVARLLREAGTILLGKLNTHEYAYGVTTNNPHFGPTRNPWDPGRIPGGSSGGSGAAIAAGLAAATLGSDTGGSIRIPASLCGVVGLKPTYGRVSKQGVLPLSYLFDHAGPITRSVEDAALVLGVIAGYDPGDPTTVPLPVADYTDRIRDGLAGLRIGVPRRYFFDRLDNEVEACVERAISEMGGMGADVREVDIQAIDSSIESVFGIVLAEAQAIHAEALRTRPGDFGPDLQAILGSPAPETPSLMAALRMRDALRVAVREVFEEVDLLVTATTPVVAADIGQEVVTYGGVEEPILLALIRCTAPFNGTGHPALSLPCGFTSAGLPIGLQIVGREFDEATVLRAGLAYEQATDWHRKVPPL
jgi:aspartyl-tRNA(Asn)/glutamyl-tRNA(Gln) amidotransferase subunit A